MSPLLSKQTNPLHAYLLHSLYHPVKSPAILLYLRDQNMSSYLSTNYYQILLSYLPPQIPVSLTVSLQIRPSSLAPLSYAYTYSSYYPTSCLSNLFAPWSTTSASTVHKMVTLYYLKQDPAHTHSVYSH